MEVAQAWARVGGAVAGPQRVYMWERKSSWKVETRKVVEGPGRVYSRGVGVGVGDPVAVSSQTEKARLLL